jgi:hypothetical protein
VADAEEEPSVRREERPAGAGNPGQGRMADSAPGTITPRVKKAEAVSGWTLALPHGDTRGEKEAPSGEAVIRRVVESGSPSALPTPGRLSA